jgi:hypothetical protein
MYTAGATLKVETSSDNWATATSRLAAATPASDKAGMKTWAAASSGAWRITLAAGTAAQRVYIGDMALGPVWTWPYYASPGLNPYDRELVAEIAADRYGSPIGRSILTEHVAASIACPWITLAQLRDEFAAWWLDAGTNGRPFYFAWNLGTYPDDVLFAYLPDSARQYAPLEPGCYVAEYRIDMEAVAE